MSAYVSKKEQEKFNKRVLLGLGLLNSQIHLVSMSEAIRALEGPNSVGKETTMFRNQIPRIAQMTIPIWKARFYAPKAACFDDL